MVLSATMWDASRQDDPTAVGGVWGWGPWGQVRVYTLMRVAKRNVALIKENGFGWEEGQRTSVLESPPRPTRPKGPPPGEVPPSRTLTL